MSRYTNIPIISVQGKKIRKTVRYPEIPLHELDTYVISTAGDRFDILAREYYQDSSLWWIISTANENLTQNSLTIPEGLQIRIPYSTDAILAAYNILNT